MRSIKRIAKVLAATALVSVSLSGCMALPVIAVAGATGGGAMFLGAQKGQSDSVASKARKKSCYQIEEKGAFVAAKNYFQGLLGNDACKN